MRTKTITSLAFLFLFNTTFYAQYSGFDQKTMALHVQSIKAFYTLSNDIAYNTNFKYRRELRKSKSDNTIFHFADGDITKTEILKNFKKAARKSMDRIQFIEYFAKKQVHYIESLDQKTMFDIYTTMRRTTLNEYLDQLVVIGEFQ